jgi:hypothetical protein
MSKLDSNEKVFQLTSLSISIRRVLLAFAPLWRISVKYGLIESPQFILTLLQLLPCVLIPDKSQKCFLQTQVISEINELIQSNPENISSISKNYIVQNKAWF